MDSKIEIYQSSDGQTQIEVKFENDTAWLSQEQISKLFMRERSVITKHIGNVFKERELDEESNVQILHIAGADRPTKFYNLNVLISVGYRVKSSQGTKFRIWATQRLKDYLIQGYAVNERRLAEKQQEVQTLKDGIRILSRAIEDKVNETDFPWLGQFATGLELLDDYDHEQLDTKGISTKKALYPEISDYYRVVETMKADFDSDVFGKKKDESFDSALIQIGKGLATSTFIPP
jgi:hypothetical protein